MMTETKYGPLPLDRLRKESWREETLHQITHHTHYYLGNELVKNDVHVHLKQGLGVEGLLGGFRG